MAKPKYTQWLEPTGLERITNWALNGLTLAEIANNVGVSDSTFRDWMGKLPAISAAVKTGREMSIQCIENMAFKVAMGQVDEEQMVKVKNDDGSERVEMRKRRLPPNPTMLIFLLKNRAGYRDNPPENIDANGSLDKARELLAGVPSVIDG